MINQLKAKYQRMMWRKAYDISQNLQLIHQRYKDIDGFELARLAKQDRLDLSLTYGEIDLESFLALLSLVKPCTHDVFYDLGSGVGKTVFAAAKTYHFKKSYGIETIASLHHVAEHQKTLFQLNGLIEFKHQNIMEINWSDANILFINVASFVADDWHALCEKILKNPVPIIITCSKALPKEYFDIQMTKVLCSWGIVPAYIQRPKKI